MQEPAEQIATEVEEFEVLFNKAVVAVEEGNIAEIDVELETEVASVRYTWRATVRREPQTFGMSPVVTVEREEE